MARGFLSGAIWGGVLGLGATGVASVLAPLPSPPDVADAAPSEVLAPDRIEQASSGETASNRDPALLTGQAEAPSPAPDPDTITALDGDAQNTASQPQTGTAAALEAPRAQTDQTDVAVQGDEPVIPNPLALAPMEPQVADDLSISTEPAQPPAPSTAEVAGAFDAPEQPAAEQDELQTALPSAVSDSTVIASAPTAPQVPATAGETDSLQDSTLPAEPTEEAQIAAITEELQVKPLAPPVTIVTQVPAVDGAEVNTAEAETSQEASSGETQAQEGEAEEPTAVVRRTIGTPSITLTDRNTGVTVNRLTTEETAPQEVTVVSELPDGSTLAPLKRYAQKFENPEGKPLMSVVLIDDGSSVVAGAAGIAALRSFPYPLSFAVDASLKDAAERMAIYRNAGMEVLAMIDLPEGALPSDAETTLGAVLPVMGEVVGVLEGTRGGLQGARDVSDQVTAILAQTGHGLITQDKGLNTMPKLARKEGVPADPVFRDFDSKGQSAQVIRRFLDQAAFKAGQEGAVVMLGRLRPDTVSALLLWGLQDRAGKVALAPISGVLLREE